MYQIPFNPQKNSGGGNIPNLQVNKLKLRDIK